jgi:glycosyltransferase involved in cell wall biosynthesis
MTTRLYGRDFREAVQLKIMRRIHFLRLMDLWNPKVTIIIPTVDRLELLLSRSLPSVFSQTYTNLEILVIGDGCSQIGSRPDFAYKDSRIRVINLPRATKTHLSAKDRWLVGPARPWNFGLRVATGDWILRLDDDDMLTRDAVRLRLDEAVEKRVEFVSTYKTIVAAGESVVDKGISVKSGYFGEMGSRLGPPRTRRDESLVPGTWLYASYLSFMRVDPNCYRKPHNRPNEIDLWIRMLQAGVSMSLLPVSTLSIYPRIFGGGLGSDAIFEPASIYVG